MIASMSSLAGWALVGSFALIIVLALACFFPSEGTFPVGEDEGTTRGRNSG